MLHFQVDEPPEELRITHRMLDKLLKVPFIFSSQYLCPHVLQISGDVSGFDCILVDDMVSVSFYNFHFWELPLNTMKDYLFTG